MFYACTYLHIFLPHVKGNVLCFLLHCSFQIYLHICLHICTFLHIFAHICTHLCRVKLMFSPSLQLSGKKSIMCWGNDRPTFAVKETTLGPTNAIIQWRKDLSARINLNLASAHFLGKHILGIRWHSRHVRYWWHLQSNIFNLRRNFWCWPFLFYWISEHTHSAFRCIKYETYSGLE